MFVIGLFGIFGSDSDNEYRFATKYERVLSCFNASGQEICLTLR